MASPRLDQLTHVDRRLLRVGAPLVLTNAVLLPLPVLARVYLGATDYATWALLLTVVMAGFLFDLGGTAYLQSAGYGVRVGRTLYLRAVGLSCLGVAVVTTIAVLAALALAQTLRISTPPRDFTLLVGITGLGCAVRAVWTVMLARLQIEERFGLRTSLAMAQALLQVALCWLALALEFGLWSLAISLTLSSLPPLLVAHLALRSQQGPMPEARPTAGLLGFASVRTLSAVIGTASSQADRWVLAAIAPATFLTSYDLAVRVASLPLSLVVTLFGGMIAESAAVDETGQRRALVARTTGRVAGLTLTFSVVGYLAVVGIAATGSPLVTEEMIVLLAMALIWLGANALTAPTTMAFIGSGRPANELRYTVPTVLCCAGGWAAAVVIGNPWIVPVVTLVSVTGWSSWFVCYGTRRARY